jgi:hypothetical protein
VLVKAFPESIPILIGSEVDVKCECLEVVSGKRGDAEYCKCVSRLCILCYGLRGNIILGCKNCPHKGNGEDKGGVLFSKYIDILNRENELSFEEMQIEARSVYEEESVSLRMQLFNGRRPTRREVEKKIKDKRQNKNINFGEWERFKGKLVSIVYKKGETKKGRFAKIRGQVEDFGVYNFEDNEYWLRIRILNNKFNDCGSIHIPLSRIKHIFFARKKKKK